jgi:predicted acetyltransferase
MILRALRVEDEIEATRAHRLMEPEGFAFLFDFTPGDDFAAYVRRTEAFNAGGDWSEGGVPGRFLVAESEGRLVGRLSLRFELDEYLRRFGGHLGYCVLPAFRRRGFASHMLMEGLRLLRSVGVDTVLVTCDDTNEGSLRVVERAGGRLLGRFPGETGHAPPKRHYVFGEGALRVRS